MFEFTRWKAFLAKHRAPAEESGLYRIVVTVLVMFALTLTLHQIEWPSYSIVVLLMTPAASYLSYRRRHSANLEIKIFLSFAMMAVLLWFLTRLTASLFDPRIPLAELLIWLQTLHAFDLPAKKDLRYTVLVALILMAMASVLTYSSWFIVFLLLFCSLFLVVAAVDFWSDNRVPGTRVGDSSNSCSPGYRMNRSWLARTLLLALPSALLAATVIFVFMPRYRGLTLRTMPFNWDIQFRLAHISNGEIVNSSLPKSDKNKSGKPEKIDGDSYFGFDSEVNLNARGSLTDRIVMKVRTSDWQYHRAVAFAEYTGGGWRSGLSEPELKEVTEPPFYFESIPANKSRLTIYYAEVDLPNVVFTPSYPQTLYFPSSELYVVNSLQGKRQKFVSNSPAFLVAPFALETGVVYSVLNRVPKPGPSEVKSLPGWRSDDPRWKAFEPYLRLPLNLPDRVKNKALEIVDGRATTWEKATALTTYLQQNYAYNLDVGFYPEQADTVDHFLFEAKEGYCEQFASTLCVMARTVGVPARYVTGYLPGSYNPLSGFYEIHANDAHAWVEIYLPNYGWMIFDPVPGGNANPSLEEIEGERWLLEAFFKYLNVPESVRKRLPAMLRLLVLAAVLSLLLALRKHGNRRVRSTHSTLSPYLQRAESYTQPRRRGETVRGWAERIGGEPPRRLADVYERTFYRDRQPQSQDYQELEDVLRELKKESKASASQRS